MRTQLSPSLRQWPSMCVAAFVAATAASPPYAQGLSVDVSWTEDSVKKLAKGGQCTVIGVSEERKGLALVIGNGSYRPDFGWLDQPPNDAFAIAALILGQGFGVYLITDASKTQISNCADLMAKDLSDGSNETAILFYSGHAVQVNDVNYVVPIEDKPINLAPDDLVSINELVDRLRRAAHYTLVFLDACRTLPAGKDQFSGLSLSTSEAPNESSPASAGSEFAITYASQPGMSAASGTGKFSLFTEALLAELGKPNQSIQETVANVSGQVGKLTGYKQQPFFRTTLSSMLILKKQLDTEDQIVRAKSSLIDARPLEEAGNRVAALATVLGQLPDDSSGWPADARALVRGELMRIYSVRVVRISVPSDSIIFGTLDNSVSLETRASVIWASKVERLVTLRSDSQGDVLIGFWNASSGMLVSETTVESGNEYGFDGGVFASGDESTVFIVSRAGVVMKFDSSSGELVARFSSVFNERADRVEDADVSQSGQYLILRSATEIVILETVGGRIVFRSSTSDGVENSGFKFSSLISSSDRLNPNPDAYGIDLDAELTASDYDLSFASNDTVCFYIGNRSSIYNPTYSRPQAPELLYSGNWFWKLDYATVDVVLPGRSFVAYGNNGCLGEAGRYFPVATGSSSGLGLKYMILSDGKLYDGGDDYFYVGHDWEKTGVYIGRESGEGSLWSFLHIHPEGGTLAPILADVNSIPRLRVLDVNGVEIGHVGLGSFEGIEWTTSATLEELIGKCLDELPPEVRASVDQRRRVLTVE